MGEDLVRGEVEFGEAARGGAQPAHGGGGVHAVADDVADDERRPGVPDRGMTSNQSPPTSDSAGR